MAHDSIGVVILGFDEVLGKLQQLGAAAPTILAQGVYEASQTVMTEAKKGCPVDTGNMRASGHVMPNTLNEAIEGDTVAFKLGFGGPSGSGNLGETNAAGKTTLAGRPHDGNVGYAATIHELGPRMGGVGRPKFLALAVMENQQRIVDIIAKHADRALKKQASGMHYTLPSFTMGNGPNGVA